MGSNTTKRVYCFDAVNFCNQLYKFCYAHPLQCNRQKLQIFTQKDKSPFPSNYILWFFHMFFVLSICGCGSCAYTIYNARALPTANVMFSTIFIPIGSFLFGCSIPLCLDKDSIVLALERMRIILEDIETQFPLNSQQEQNKIGRWKDINFSLKVAIFALFLSPIFMPAFAVFWEIDPFVNVYKLAIQPHFCSSVEDNSQICQVANSISIGIRYYLSLMSVLEGNRSYAIYITVIFLWLEMQSRYFQKFENMSQNLSFFKFYSKFQLALGTWDIALNEWLRTLLGAFFLTIVVCNVVTLRYGSMIPLSILWFLPTAAITEVMLIFWLFQYITACHEDTERILFEQRACWRNRKSDKNFRYFSKRIKSLRPVSLKCGDSFVLKQETKSTYYQAIVETTVDGLLL